MINDGVGNGPYLISTVFIRANKLEHAPLEMSGSKHALMPVPWAWLPGQAPGPLERLFKRLPGC